MSYGEYQQGSSPLSRGIRPFPWSGHPRPRIIPALAGNTGCPTRQAHPRGDHPRSRGEYPFTGVGHLPYTGSSPLSRGIPSPYNIIGVFDRIIPALAGNTASARWGRRPRRDHPRSRGEYPPEEVDGQPVRGSSPLSRGILLLVLTCEHILGIIPALAGNTAAVPYRSGPGWDHPRSRGEYWGDNEPDSSLVGSSPLSRGILAQRHDLQRTRGIIPALAGNTIEPAGPVLPAGDHPRSRGEYSNYGRAP